MIGLAIGCSIPAIILPLSKLPEAGDWADHPRIGET